MADSCKSIYVFDNLQQVHRQYLLPSGLAQCQVITDDGSENKGPVIGWSQEAASPTVQLLTAMQDIEFSNSMIEAANKQIKYRFLYHQHIPDAAALAIYLQKAIDDYNNRPYHVLGGLTPLEVLSGKVIGPSVNREMIHRAKIARVEDNKKAKCCYSF